MTTELTDAPVAARPLPTGPRHSSPSPVGGPTALRHALVLARRSLIKTWRTRRR